jgi:HTH-type transcriptional regulator/antitoxin HigA
MEPNQEENMADNEPEGGHFCPDWVVPPGATIKDLLTEQYISERVFARIMHMQPEDVTALLAGDLTLNDQIAGRLGAVFGPSRAFWLNLERRYRAGSCRESHA